MHFHNAEYVLAHYKGFLCHGMPVLLCSNVSAGQQSKCMRHVPHVGHTPVCSAGKVPATISEPLKDI